MKFRIGAAVIAAAVLASSLAYANPEIIKLRDGLMNQNGQAMKVLILMVRGNMEYDGNVATAALTQIANTASIFPALFPAGSEMGNTIAAPVIFSDPAGFAAVSAKMQADATAAAALVQQAGLDGLKAVLGSVGGNCQACHDNWRTE
ncbi:MAG: c-type cytochrome [Alphaproteobacteria bacterium]